MGSDVLSSPGVRPSVESESLDSSINALKATVVLTASGVAGRVALQHVPSVEPLIAVAAASGFYFGARYGVASGASGFLISNFLVFGGQGPWTVFQVLGAGFSGLAGGFSGKLFENRYGFLLSVLIGVLGFELFVNLGSVVYASFSGVGVGYLVAAAPFSGAHVLSSLGFGGVIYGAKEMVEKYRV